MQIKAESKKTKTRFCQKKVIKKDFQPMETLLNCLKINLSQLNKTLYSTANIRNTSEIHIQQSITNVMNSI